jgi:hypothetical protein
MNSTGLSLGAGRGARNVPGQLLAAGQHRPCGIGSGASSTEAALAKVKLDASGAELEAYHQLANRSVVSLVLDDGGRALVTHRSIWNPRGNYANLTTTRLSIVSSPGNSPGYDALYEHVIPQWMSLQQAGQHRAFFRVSGGLLMADTEDAANPVTKAFFQTSYGNSAALLDGSDVLVAAGRYGIQQLPIDGSNLLMSGD